MMAKQMAIILAAVSIPDKDLCTSNLPLPLPYFIIGPILTLFQETKDYKCEFLGPFLFLPLPTSAGRNTILPSPQVTAF
jgi:hypothetical protein